MSRKVDIRLLGIFVKYMCINNAYNVSAISALEPSSTRSALLELFETKKDSKKVNEIFRAIYDQQKCRFKYALSILDITSKQDGGSQWGIWDNR